VLLLGFSCASQTQLFACLVTTERSERVIEPGSRAHAASKRGREGYTRLRAGWWVLCFTLAPNEVGGLHEIVFQTPLPSLKCKRVNPNCVTGGNPENSGTSTSTSTLTLTLTSTLTLTLTSAFHAVDTWVRARTTNHAL